MKDKIEDINKELKKGKIVVTDDKILDNHNIKKPVPIDLVTTATMGTTFKKATKRYLKKKGHMIDEK